MKKQAKAKGITSVLEIAWPEEGAVNIQRPVAIIKKNNRSEKKKLLSRKFVDFLLSKELQATMSKFDFISVRNDMESLANIPADVEVVNVDWDYIHRMKGGVQKKFKEITFEK